MGFSSWAVAALLAAVAAAVVADDKKPPKPPPVVGQAGAAESGEAASRAPQPVEPARPTQFTMAIATQPTGADVFNGAERLGTTPCDVVLPASEKPVELIAEQEGLEGSAAQDRARSRITTSWPI